MKRRLRIFTVLALLLTALLTLCGCRQEFDASSYLKAILDNSYKHDPTAFLDQEIGTEEQAEELFQQGIDNNMEAMTASLSVPEEQKGDFRTLFEAIYGKADYTVGEAEKQEDDSYVVTVTYRPMELFSQVETQLMDEVNNLTESYMEQAMNGGEVPDEETLTLEILQLYKDVVNSPFINTGISPSKIDETISEFEAMGFDDKKRAIINILDTNMLYVNLSDMDDPDYAVSESMKAFNRSFYG